MNNVNIDKKHLIVLAS